MPNLDSQIIQKYLLSYKVKDLDPLVVSDSHCYCSKFGKNLPGQISENSLACCNEPSQTHIHVNLTFRKWSLLSASKSIISVPQPSQKLWAQTSAKISPKVGAVPNISKHLAFFRQMNLLQKWYFLMLFGGPRQKIKTK